MKKIFFFIGVIAITGLGALFSACGDDKDDDFGKTPNYPVMPEVVEFTFARGNIDQIKPVTNIAAAGQNPYVKVIKIKSNNTGWGLPGWSLIQNFIGPAFAAANGKGTGDGTPLNWVDFKYTNGHTGALEDSLQLVKWGYVVNAR